MRLGKTALYHFSTQIVISFSGFAATFFIGVLGGASDLGYFKYAVALGFFWLAIPASGISQAIKKRMSEGEEPDQFFGGGLLLNALLSISIGSIVLFVGWILRVLGAPDLVAIQVLVMYNAEIALLLVGSTMMKTTLAGLEGQKQVVESGAVNALERILRSVVHISLVVFGFGVATFTLGQAGTLLIAAAIGLGVATVRPVRPRLDHLRELLTYAKYAWVGALRGRVYGWMDTIMLGIFLSGSAGALLIGVYEVAWGLASLLATASYSISTTLFPEMSDLSSDGDYDRVRHYLNEALAFSGLIVIPGLIGALVIGERVLQFYRPQYVQGHVVLVVLIGAYVADVYASQFLNSINAVDRPDIAMWVNWIFIGANIALNVVLILLFGWTGAAAATAISAGVRLTGGYVAVSAILQNVPFPSRAIGLQFCSAVFMAAGVLAVNSSIPQGRGWTLGLVCFGATLYLSVLLALSGRFRNKAQMILYGSVTE